MNIVGVCMHGGIAHTLYAKKKIETAAKKARTAALNQRRRPSA